MEKRNRFYAIIAAAGQGSRMETKTSKQFIEISGIPIVARTLLAFQNSPHIDGIVVVTCSNEIDNLLNLCTKYNITKLNGITEGGTTRQESVRYALRFLSSCIDSESAQIPKEDCYVLIHDGARPLISQELIERCIEGVKKYNACGAGVKVKDTIKLLEPEGCKIKQTIPRDDLRAIQTPQSFLLPLIEKLHQKAYENNLQFTDDLSIAEYFGEDVMVVDGDYRNIKITTKEDLLYAELLLTLI